MKEMRSGRQLCMLSTTHPLKEYGYLYYFHIQTEDYLSLCNWKKARRFLSSGHLEGKTSLWGCVGPGFHLHQQAIVPINLLQGRFPPNNQENPAAAAKEQSGSEPRGVAKWTSLFTCAIALHSPSFLQR